MALSRLPRGRVRSKAVRVPASGGGASSPDRTEVGAPATIRPEVPFDLPNPSFSARALVAFFALTYALSWSWVIPLAATGSTVYPGKVWPTHFPTLLGPMVAAFAVTARTVGRHGVRDLVRRMGRWRIG